MLSSACSIGARPWRQTSGYAEGASGGSARPAVFSLHFPGGAVRADARRHRAGCTISTERMDDAVGLIPLVGWLYLLYLYVQPGTAGPNKYGPDRRPMTPGVAWIGILDDASGESDTRIGCSCRFGAMPIFPAVRAGWNSGCGNWEGDLLHPALHHRLAMIGPAIMSSDPTIPAAPSSASVFLYLICPWSALHPGARSQPWVTATARYRTNRL